MPCAASLLILLAFIATTMAPASPAPRSKKDIGSADVIKAKEASEDALERRSLFLPRSSLPPLRPPKPELAPRPPKLPIAPQLPHPAGRVPLPVSLHASQQSDFDNRRSPLSLDYVQGRSGFGPTAGLGQHPDDPDLDVVWWKSELTALNREFWRYMISGDSEVSLNFKQKLSSAGLSFSSGRMPGNDVLNDEAVRHLMSLYMKLADRTPELDFWTSATRNIGPLAAIDPATINVDNQLKQVSILMKLRKNVEGAPAAPAPHFDNTALDCVQQVRCQVPAAYAAVKAIARLQGDLDEAKQTAQTKRSEFSALYARTGQGSHAVFGQIALLGHKVADSASKVEANERKVQTAVQEAAVQLSRANSLLFGTNTVTRRSNDEEVLF